MHELEVFFFGSQLENIKAKAVAKTSLFIIKNKYFFSIKALNKKKN